MLENVEEAHLDRAQVHAWSKPWSKAFAQPPLLEALAEARSGAAQAKKRFQPPELDLKSITAARARAWQALETDKRFMHQREAVEQLVEVSVSQKNFAHASVQLGQAFDLDDRGRSVLEPALEAFKPWKKGPFQLFGIEVDAEWRSDLKWSRLVPKLDTLKGHVVADIGCNNGYFMYRMLEFDPRMVVGFEPVGRHYYNFWLLQRYARSPKLYFELLGVEQIDLFPQTFDTVFCLGILYHHPDPIGLLRKLFVSLKPKGQLIIDCQGIAGSEPVALMPAGRYARMRGMWFLPTLSCLQNWVRRSGFGDSEVIFSGKLDPSEQRRTEWADVDSLGEFLDPADPEKTVEGYPAPWRFYLKVKKA